MIHVLLLLSIILYESKINPSLNKEYKQEVQRCPQNRQTNGRNYTNFKTNLAVIMIYVPVKFEFDWTKLFELESGKENVEGQTDIGHINLIGGLVTRNQPKKAVIYITTKTSRSSVIISFQ